MIEIRHFTKDDCEFLINNFYHDMAPSEADNMVNDWNRCLHNNSYFEMFAVTLGNEIIGSVSLYAHGNDVISAGPEILEEYRKKDTVLWRSGWR